MKTTHRIATIAIALAAYLASVDATAGPRPKLPEIPTLEQARAATLARIKTQEALAAPEPTDDILFYTGKPFVDQAETYAFRYRAYDPELSRWTSIDPSGFPDGANNARYCSVPTQSFDIAGLLDWQNARKVNAIGPSQSGSGWTAFYDIYQAEAGDGRNVELWKLASVQGTLPQTVDPTFNCFGYMFAGASYWVPSSSVSDIIDGDGYKEITNGDFASAKIAIWNSPAAYAHGAVVTASDSSEVTEVAGKFNIIAGITTSSPSGQWQHGEPVFYE